MRLIILAALSLSACTTTMAGMAERPIAQTYQSAKARSTVVDCLLNRVTSDGLDPHVSVGEDATSLGFTGRGLAMNPAVYLFTIRDAHGGSTIDVRRQAGFGLASAETCF